MQLSIEFYKLAEELQESIVNISKVEYFYKKFGLYNQKMKFQEEILELCESIIKTQTKKNKYKYKKRIIKELYDVMLTLSSLVYYYKSKSLNLKDVNKVIDRNIKIIEALHYKENFSAKNLILSLIYNIRNNENLFNKFAFNLEVKLNSKLKTTKKKF